MELLQAAGHDAMHVGAIGMAAASDVAILDVARKEGAVVVTLDADFHAIMALGQLREPSIVRLRAEGLDAARAASLIASVIVRTESELRAGALVTAAPGVARVRRLPIG